MEIKIEEVFGTGSESHIWSLYHNNVQLCCSQLFSDESDAINNANIFIDLFNSDIKLEKKATKKRLFKIVGK